GARRVLPGKDSRTERPEVRRGHERAPLPGTVSRRSRRARPWRGRRARGGGCGLRFHAFCSPPNWFFTGPRRRGADPFSGPAPRCDRIAFCSRARILYRRLVTPTRPTDRRYSCVMTTLQFFPGPVLGIETS